MVAGGAGFIGSHLCERLIADGWEVVCLDNLLTGSARNISSLVKRKGFTFTQVDVGEPVRVDGAVDLVAHLASPASPPDYLRMPLQTLRCGAEATWRLLDLAREKDARLLFTSTSEVYGDPEVHPQREDYWGNVNPVGPRSVYDEAKRFAEALVMAYRRTHGTDTAIVRIFNTFGPRMRPDDGRAVPAFIGHALRDRPIVLYGDGSQTRSLCYVSDTVDGIIRMIGSHHPGPLNIGGTRETTVLELAKLIRQRCGSNSTLNFAPATQDDPRRRRPDISLAQGLLGWEPATPLETGLDRTISWFKTTSA
ncbi:UDP-glucuronic acid decarboxylase family protein [Streptomyces sp. NPDC007205]|uniref:UDP-glucuronic acid decarboxylase family protein n=1 Tax=Streptomyces sp. NPDC007205 TaxID=3154316 RepID=UPI0033F896C3